MSFLCMPFSCRLEAVGVWVGQDRCRRVGVYVSVRVCCHRVCYNVSVVCLSVFWERGQNVGAWLSSCLRTMVRARVCVPYYFFPAPRYTFSPHRAWLFLNPKVPANAPCLQAQRVTESSCFVFDSLAFYQPKTREILLCFYVTCNAIHQPV